MKKTYFVLVGCIFCITLALVIRNVAVRAGVPPFASVSAAIRNSFSTPEIYPKPKTGASALEELSAHSYAVLYDSGSEQKYLLTKNADERVLIASITKLVTAAVVLNSSAHSVESFSPLVLAGQWGSGRYKATDTLAVSELVKSMLVESDNDAARAICLDTSLNILDRMNTFATRIGASGSHFYNCTGLDDENGGTNVATAQNVISFLRFIVENRAELLDITNVPTATIYNLDGSVHHVATSTYQFIGAELPFPIIGGKTGTTDKAKENLVLALKVPHGTLYVAVLGSDNRVLDMKKLVDYLYQAYEW